MKKSVFLGDSITAGFEQLQQNGIINMGISGDKTTDLIGRFIHVILEQPDQLFLMIGTNDLLVKERFWQDFFSIDYEVLYKALLTLIKDNLPNCKTYLLSVFPVSIEGKDNQDLNNKIDEMNRFIEQSAKEYSMQYIDVNTPFKDESGFLKQEFTGDGVHLSVKGYDTYFKLLQQYLF